MCIFWGEEDVVIRRPGKRKLDLKIERKMGNSLISSHWTMVPQHCNTPVEMIFFCLGNRFVIECIQGRGSATHYLPASTGKINIQRFEKFQSFKSRKEGR